jgi:succinyl-diaminopimelate desuccinylase
MDVARALQAVEASRDEMVETLAELCKVPAIPPESGGDGEAEKFALLREVLDDFGFPKGKDYPSRDPRVPGGKRHNLMVKVKGNGKRDGRVWVVSHMDIVPPGELSLWKTDPYKPVMKGGKLYGRGTEDNGQAIVCSTFAAKALLDEELEPTRDVILAYVSDEEVGSHHGIQHIVNEGLIKTDDIVLVPDSGHPEGKYIEVVEKSHAQYKITVKGKQVHASRPHKGINAYRAAAGYVSDVTRFLYSKYSKRDRLFQPPHSTFEPTKRLANVPNINTIPGEDISFMDFRVLPEQSLDEILWDMKAIAQKHSRATGARIRIEPTNVSQAPSRTPIDSPVVVLLGNSVEEVMGFKPKPIGIGGGTCAAFFRRAGIPAAVWSTLDEKAHEPNEYVVVRNLVNDAKVYAHLFLTA